MTTIAELEELTDLALNNDCHCLRYVVRAVANWDEAHADARRIFQECLAEAMVELGDLLEVAPKLLGYRSAVDMAIGYEPIGNWLPPEDLAEVNKLSEFKGQAFRLIAQPNPLDPDLLREPVTKLIRAVATFMSQRHRISVVRQPSRAERQPDR